MGDLLGAEPHFNGNPNGLILPYPDGVDMGFLHDDLGIGSFAAG